MGRTPFHMSDCFKLDVITPMQKRVRNFLILSKILQREFIYFLLIMGGGITMRLEKTKIGIWAIAIAV